VRRAALAVALLALLASTSCDEIRDHEHPVCDQRPPTILMAESVPGATMIPCVRSLPLGWAFASFDAREGSSEFSLDSDAGGPGALLVRFTATCHPQGTHASSDETGAQLTERRTSGDPYAATWTYTFPGGCASYAIRFGSGAPADRLVGQIRSGLSFIERRRVLAGLSSTELEPEGR
jgi:hypothetical protein